MSCKWCEEESGCDCQERIKCDRTGRPGHWMCGMCPTHNEPRFICGCVRTVSETTGEAAPTSGQSSDV